MNKPNDFFDDFTDDMLGGAKVSVKQQQTSSTYVAPTTFKNIPKGERQTFTEPCPKCRGTGVWRGWGSASGSCFKCKGSGKLNFKSSPTERATKREQTQRVKETKRQETIATALTWQQEHPAETAWLNAKCGSFSFAMSLQDALTKFGSLTEGQLAAVRKCIARDADRKAEQQEKIDNAASIDVSKIEKAFEIARTNAKEMGALGIRWLKLRLDTFLFMDAPASGTYSAAILVREGEKKLGRIANGKFVRSFNCDDPTEARVLAVAADPQAAAIAYGQKFSSCAICGRELTDPESIKRSIGPICAEKFGW